MNYSINNYAFWYLLCDVSSISGRFKPYFGGIGPLRMTGSDGRDRKWRDRKTALIGSDVTEECSAHARNFPAFFFLTIVVVQNVPLCMTDMVTGSDVIKHHVTWTKVITCACTTGSCAISALLGLFTWSDVIKRHVTPKGFPWKAIVTPRPFSLPCK